MARKKTAIRPVSTSNNLDGPSQLIVQLIQDKYDRLVEDLHDEVEENKGNIEKTKEMIEQRCKEAKQDALAQVDTFFKMNDKRIDAIDDALRGSEDRMGMFEMIRRHQVYVRVMGAAIILLLGFRIWGLGLNDIIKPIIKKIGPAETEQIEGNQQETTKEDKETLETLEPPIMPKPRPSTHRSRRGFSL